MFLYIFVWKMSFVSDSYEVLLLILTHDHTRKKLLSTLVRIQISETKTNNKEEIFIELLIHGKYFLKVIYYLTAYSRYNKCTLFSYFFQFTSWRFSCSRDLPSHCLRSVYNNTMSSQKRSLFCFYWIKQFCFSKLRQIKLLWFFSTLTILNRPIHLTWPPYHSLKSELIDDNICSIWEQIWKDRLVMNFILNQSR